VKRGRSKRGKAWGEREGDHALGELIEAHWKRSEEKTPQWKKRAKHGLKRNFQEKPCPEKNGSKKLFVQGERRGGIETRKKRAPSLKKGNTEKNRESMKTPRLAGVELLACAEEIRGRNSGRRICIRRCVVRKKSAPAFFFLGGLRWERPARKRPGGLKKHGQVQKACPANVRLPTSKSKKLPEDSGREQIEEIKRGDRRKSIS